LKITKQTRQISRKSITSLRSTNAIAKPTKRHNKRTLLDRFDSIRFPEMKCSIVSILVVLIVAVSSVNGFSVSTPQMALSGIAGGEKMLVSTQRTLSQVLAR
jgi:hypothetical protein